MLQKAIVAAHEAGGFSLLLDVETQKEEEASDDIAAGAIDTLGNI
jgi:hypothetical protein